MNAEEYFIKMFALDTLFQASMDLKNAMTHQHTVQ